MPSFFIFLVESISKKLGQKSDDNSRVNSNIIRLMNEAKIILKQEQYSASNFYWSFNTCKKLYIMIYSIIA